MKKLSETSYLEIIGFDKDIKEKIVFAKEPKTII